MEEKQQALQEALSTPQQLHVHDHDEEDDDRHSHSTHYAITCTHCPFQRVNLTIKASLKCASVQQDVHDDR